MAKRKEDTETQEGVLEQGKTKPAKKHYLRGLFVYGSIVYSDSEDAEYQMTDEIAEQLVALDPAYKQLFRIWDGKEQ